MSGKSFLEPSKKIGGGASGKQCKDLWQSRQGTAEEGDWSEAVQATLGESERGRPDEQPTAQSGEESAANQC